MNELAYVCCVPLFLVAGCSKSPEAEVPAPEVTTGAGVAGVSAEVPKDEGDFRGHRWGEPMAVVIERESRRSEKRGDGYTFATELAGYPTVVRLLYLGDVFAGARYSFPWPDESDKCSGPMLAGSECSLGSAAYAVEVCDRLGDLLSEKYRLVDADGRALSTRAVKSAAALDRVLASDPTSEMDWVVNLWSAERTMVFQTFARGRSDDEGWRCTFSYRSTPEIAAQIDRAATEDENDAAKKDL
jgi:hypothetical protein